MTRDDVTALRMTPHATRILALAWRTQRPLVGWLVAGCTVFTAAVVAIGG